MWGVSAPPTQRLSAVTGNLHTTIAAIAWAILLCLVGVFAIQAVQTNREIDAKRADVAATVGLMVRIDGARTRTELTALESELKDAGLGSIAWQVSHADPSDAVGLAEMKSDARIALRSRSGALSTELGVLIDSAQNLLYTALAFAFASVLLGGLAIVQIQRRTQLLQDLANHQLEARQHEDRDAFTLAMTHDLQSPLRAIRGFADLLAESLDHVLKRPEALDDPAKRVEQLDSMRSQLTHIQQAGTQMFGLIDGLHALARVGKARTRGTWQVDDLVRLVASTLSADLAAIGGRLDCPDGLPKVEGPQVELIRLFQNLMENAIRYRAADRPLVIRVSVRDPGDPDRIEVVFADNGVGIRPAMRDRVFEPFVRDIPENGPVGTGLGLAICKRVVEADGGQIWVRDADPGTAVHVTLRKVGR